MGARGKLGGGDERKGSSPEPTTRQDLGEPDFRRGSPRSACLSGGPSYTRMALALASSTLVDASGGCDRCVEVSRWSDSAILAGPELS